jgi:hypothetical protein
MERHKPFDKTDLKRKRAHEDDCEAAYYLLYGKKVVASIIPAPWACLYGSKWRLYINGALRGVDCRTLEDAKEQMAEYMNKHPKRYLDQEGTHHDHF